MPGGWDRLARREGGTVVSLAAVPRNDGTTTFFAATAVGLFRSNDMGRQWLCTSERPVPLLTAVAPSARFAENDLLFAGSRSGVFRSADAGRTWHQTLSGSILTMAVVSDDKGEERVFVGTAQDGILLSQDGGRTWSGANPGLLDLTVLALAFSPDAAQGQTGFAATPSGLYRSRNGGKSWREVMIPIDEPAIQCLAISPAFARDHLVLAGTETEGLWRSEDGGTAWTRVPGLPDGSIGAIAFLPDKGSKHFLAVATSSGVAFSFDGGATWKMTGKFLSPVLALAGNLTIGAETVIAGQYRHGIARFQAGASDGEWVPSNTGLEAVHLAALVSSALAAPTPTVFTAGPDTGVLVSCDGGYTWSDATGDLGAVTIHDLAVAPDRASSLLIAATDDGIYRSRDGGTTWTPPSGTSATPTELVAIGTPASSAHPVIVAGTRDGRLIVSEDEGERWRSLTLPLTGAAILAVACVPHPAHFPTLYVGTTGKTEGMVCLWRSHDGGEHWTCCLDERGGGTLPLALSPDGTPFVGSHGRVLRQRRDVWQTRDGIRSPLWESTTLAGEDGGTVTITALAISPDYVTDGMIFAATTTGIYRSCDRGKTFDRWNENLSAQPILSLLATVATDDASGEQRVCIFATGINGAIWRRAIKKDETISPVTL